MQYKSWKDTVQFDEVSVLKCSMWNSMGTEETPPGLGLLLERNAKQTFCKLLCYFVVICLPSARSGSGCDIMLSLNNSCRHGICPLQLYSQGLQQSSHLPVGGWKYKLSGVYHCFQWEPTLSWRFFMLKKGMIERQRSLRKVEKPAE